MLFAGMPGDGNLLTALTFCVWWRVVMHCLNTPASVVSSLFRSRPLGLIGSILHPLYLSHGLALHRVFGIVSGRLAPTATSVALLIRACAVASVIVALLLHATIEQQLPVQRAAPVGNAKHHVVDLYRRGLKARISSNLFCF